MRVKLIANPGSGGGTDTDRLERDLGELGAELVDEGAERVIVASGDGSIGAAAEEAARRGVPLGVVPAGTANDFARRMQLPLDAEEAARLAVRGTETRVLDLARIGADPFVNVASTGLAVVAAEHAKPAKKLLGPLAYSLGAVRAGLGAAPFRCAVVSDGEPVFDGRAWQVIVANSGGFGGGAHAAPAEPDDGMLDVLVVEAGSRARLVVHAYGMRRGNLAWQEGAHHARGRSIRLEVAHGTCFNVDGEVREHGACEATVEPKAFELVVAGPGSV